MVRKVADGHHRGVRREVGPSGQFHRCRVWPEAILGACYTLRVSFLYSKRDLPTAKVPKQKGPVTPTGRTIRMRRSAGSLSLIAKVRAAAYGPPGAAETEGGDQEDHPQRRVGVQVRDAERRVAGGVDGVEDRVKERRHLQHVREHPDGVEHAAKEGQRLDHD